VRCEDSIQDQDSEQVTWAEDDKRKFFWKLLKQNFTSPL
jgi:hypothetical protein